MASNDNTGFCVPYTVRPTPDKGLGVFANAPIPKGTILWRHVPGQYAVYDEQSLRKFLTQLPHSEVVYELTHMFGITEFPDYVIRIFDEGVLINHSDRPTTKMNNGSGKNEIPYNTSPKNIQEVKKALLNDRFALIATKNLKTGDELTIDYNKSVDDPPYYNDLYKQYGVSEPYLQGDRIFL